MRICLVTTEYPPSIGGMGLAVRRLARALARHCGHEMHVLWLDNSWNLKEHSRPAGQALEESTPGSLHVHRSALQQWEHGNPYRAIYTRLQNLYREVGDFGIIVAFGVSYSGFPVVLLGKEVGIPTVVSMHGADLNIDAFKSERFAHIRWSLANATELVSVSPAELDMAHSICDLAGRGVLIPNHVDPDEFEQGVTAAVPVDRSSIVVAMAATIAPIKGLHVLLEAATQIRDLRLTLLIIGDARQQDQEYFETQRRQFGHRLVMVETGIVPHERILSYFHLADIFVLPSLSEGWPGIVLEAMLAGLPVVASDVGAVRHMVEDGVTGLLVAPGSVDELVAALSQLGQDADLRRRLAEAGRQMVITRFSAANEAAAWDGVFQRLHMLREGV